MVANSDVKLLIFFLQIVGSFQTKGVRDLLRVAK